MAEEIKFEFPDIKIQSVTGETEYLAEVDTSRLEKQFGEAQKLLDAQVMTDMEPFMPHVTNNLIANTQRESHSIVGSGQVYAGAGPYGHFLYVGKVMVDSKTRSPWAREGAKKVYTDRKLTYGRAGATAEWFEAAKKKHGDSWVKKVKETAGGGEQ